MYALSMSGAIGSDPCTPFDSASLIKSIDLAFRATYDAVFGTGLPIAGTDLDPFTPDLGAVTAVRAIAIRAVDGQSLVVLLTSQKGTNQAFPVSDLLLLRAQNPGDEYTAVKVVGTGAIEYIIAGNRAP